MARPLRERLLFELESIRSETLSTLEALNPARLDQAPAAGMKSYRDLIVEIGAMEAEAAILLTTSRVPEWPEAEACMKGAAKEDLLRSLQEIRERLHGWLRAAEDADLELTLQVPESWKATFGDVDVERQELVRWVARHEYYHLGQIVSYLWLEGVNPYSR